MRISVTSPTAVTAHGRGLRAAGRWLTLALSMLAACAQREPAPKLLALEPNTVSSLVDTAVTLSGEDLFDTAHVNLDSSAHTRVQRQWRVQLADVFETTSVRRVDSQHLRFVLPAGTSAGGPYDVVVTTPLGTSLRLKAALAVDTAPVGLPMSIESRPDGGGSPVEDLDLAAGQQLGLYAVFRDHEGAFVASDHSVTWQVEGDAVELDRDGGASVRVRAVRAGDAVISASADTGARATTGQLHVFAGAPPGLVDAQLSIEDAPMGLGQPLSIATGLTADDRLMLYAVLRDQYGSFVADVLADWSADAPIGQPQALASSTSLSFELTHPGTATITATAGDMRAQVEVTEVLPGHAASLEIVPDQASLVSGEAALTLEVDGRDADGNPTTDLGQIRWAVVDGSLSSCDPVTGVFTPLHAGTGHVQAASSHGPVGVSGLFTVQPGPPAALAIAGLPDGPIRVGGPDIALSVDATDAAGNETETPTPIVWSVTDGTLGALDSSSGVLSPRVAGTAVLQAQGAGLRARTLPITISPGPAASLQIEPDVLTLSADDAPVQFVAHGLDAYDNPTADLGSLSWSLASGSLSALDPDTGILDPTLAGSDKVQVASDYGPSATSSTISVTAGRPVALSLVPSTWQGSLGGPAQQFTAVASDADGNPTTDVGNVTFSVASGPIGDIDPATGVLTPASTGTGSLRVDSDLGLSALSGPVEIGPFTACATISALRLPDSLFATQNNARVELDLDNACSGEVLLTGTHFDASIGKNDVSSQLQAKPSAENSDHVPGSSTRKLVYYLDVGNSFGYGTLQLTASVDVFHPVGGPFTASATASTDAWSTTFGPSVSLTAPTAANRRKCVGQSVTFACSTGFTTSPSYAWLLPSATPASSTQAGPSASYAQPGAFLYEVTLTDVWGLHDTAVAKAPIFVGELATDPTHSYPTGPIALSPPAGGTNIDLSTLPRSDVIGIGAGQDLLQCDGQTSIDPSGDRYVSLFIDRGRIDPSADDHPELPGIQVDLDVGTGRFGAVPLLAESPALEGGATLYAEYFRPDLQRVTAAGTLALQFTNDTEPPSVTASSPAADCGAGCYGKGEPFVFRFSEPMNAASLANVGVQVLSGACSSAVAMDLSASSTHSYDAASNTLFVYPSVQPSSSYTLQVTLGTQLTDAAATPNALVALTRCAGLTDVTPNAAPQPPAVTRGRNPFSPDGDGFEDSTSWDVAVDAATRYVRVAITRGDSQVWAYTELTPSAGTYSIAWDGRDSSGRVVDDAVYRVDVVAHDLDGGSAQAPAQTIEVDSAVHFAGVQARY